MVDSGRLLEILTKHQHAYLSMGQLSAMLAIGDAEVLLQIQHLSGQGAEIELSAEGFRLLHVHDSWRVDWLQQRIRAEVHHYIEIDSTQRVAHRLAEEGAAHGTMVLADLQHAGRGRLQRTWQSAYARSILISLILRPDISVQHSPQFTLLTVVALVEAIRRSTKLQAGIKWPNDVLIGSKKLAGMLLETVSEANRIRYVIAGIGLNVNQTSADFSEDLRHKVTSLRIEKGAIVSREEVLVAFLQVLEQLLREYESDGFAPVRERWLRDNVSLGRLVRLTTQHGVLEGMAEGIDESGALLVRTREGQLVKNYSGDLEIIPVE